MNKKNFDNYLNKMIPSFFGMPICSKAVNTKELLKKLNKNHIKNKEYIEKKLGNELVESYFTSKVFIAALKMKKKISINNTKKENLYNLLKNIRNKKKYFKKKFKNA